MANMVRSSILDMCGSSPAGMTGSRAMIGRPRLRRRADVLEDPERPLVVPVVEDQGQEVGVRPGGHGFEEVARLCAQPVTEPMSFDGSTRLGDHVGQVEGHPGRRRRAGQDLSQEGAVGAADVDDLPAPR